MKEVTICFSFSVKDGLLNNLYRPLATLHGWSTDGTRSSENRKNGLRNALKLLEQITDVADDVLIKSVALSERKAAIPLDDLKTKNTAHAKGE